MINWPYIREQAKDLLLFAAFIAAVMILVIGVYCISTGDDSNGTIKYHGTGISMLQAASNSAAQCGGYLIIDMDDGEALVGGCDR